jgi:hypothetical protein
MQGFTAGVRVILLEGLESWVEIGLSLTAVNMDPAYYAKLRCHTKFGRGTWSHKRAFREVSTIDHSSSVS